MNRFALPARAVRRPAVAARAGLVVGATAALLLGTAPGAGAHVSVTPSTTAAGATSLLTFSVGHGCDGSPTTALAIRMPEEVVTVTPAVHPGWRVEKVMAQLDTPVEGPHGTTYTERVDRVVFTARTPLPDGFRDTFDLQLQLPAEEGTALTFPVVQTCERGETAWVQTVEEGEEEPESPAPFLMVTAAEDGPGTDHHTGQDTGHAAAPGTVGAQAAAVVPAEEAGSAQWAGWTGLVLGVAGLLCGGAALVRSRR